MATTNLGRVQGAGFFYSSAASSTSVALSTITPSNITPLVGDSVEFSNGDVRTVQSVSASTVTLGAAVANFKGPQGPKGDKGDTGATGPQGLKGDTGATGVSITSATITAV